MPPSTEWKEKIAPDEDVRFAKYAERFAALQARHTAMTGEGRALHRKGLLGLNATFEVLADLPAHAKHGLFAKPGVHNAWVRLSNGGPHAH
jgi:hypothetical protein